MQQQRVQNIQIQELSKLYIKKEVKTNGQIQKKIQHIPQQTSKTQNRQKKPVVLEIVDVEEGNVQKITLQTGPWKEEEHQNYLKVIRKYENQLKQGQSVKRLFDLIQIEIPTRNMSQIKRHHFDHNPYKDPQKKQESNAVTEVQKSDADEWIRWHKWKQDQNDVQWIPAEEIIEYNPETKNQFSITNFGHSNFENTNDHNDSIIYPEIQPNIDSREYYDEFDFNNFND